MKIIQNFNNQNKQSSPISVNASTLSNLNVMNFVGEERKVKSTLQNTNYDKLKNKQITVIDFDKNDKITSKYFG